ncbi:monocarboxylate transporter 9-like [Ylistrum balloti]|uniref:monocarboxylate transporter 9-like n=1 Tax=Ylistrum balloti TaxID=509963 RepID=UPI002905E9AB|nr:monocarboxylate transporter 9-like [Ylistrum balloti]
MSVLNTEFLRAFGKSKAETALVQSVTAGMLLNAGFPCGQFVNKFGVRKMGICAGFLASIGLILSFLATSIPYLITSVGVVTGFGLSLGFVSITTSVGEHFHGKARFVALSFVSSGSGCGAMVFPFLLDYLIKMYGWRGCLLIVGGLMANMICFTAICKPPSPSIQQNFPRLLVNDDINSSQQTPHNQQIVCSYENKTFTVNNTSYVTPNQEHSFIAKLKVLTGNYTFILFIVAVCCTLPAYDATLIYLIEFLKTKSFADKDALLLYFFMNVGNTTGRLVPGLCKHIPHMGALIIPALFTSLSCLSVVGLLEASSYYQHVLLMCCFGVSMGGNVTVLSMTTMKLVGLANYSVGVGILMTLVGLCCMCSGAISGGLFDITGSYMASFYGVAACHGVAVFLYIIAASMRKYKAANTKEYPSSANGELL